MHILSMILQAISITFHNLNMRLTCAIYVEIIHMMVMIVNNSSHLSMSKNRCQSIDQNIDSFGSNQIQTHQYPVIHPPSQEISEEFFQAKGDLMKSIQTFFEKFNCIPFGEKPEILLQAWGKIFAIQHAQPKDSNELFQKLLEDLQIINKELSEKQKQNMEDTMLELIEVCRQKKFYCMHDNFDDLIESALNSKLLSINLESQRLDKKNQEVKNVIEQPTKCGTHITKSLQNFRVIHKKNTSQNSPVHAITPVLPTEEPEYSLSTGVSNPLFNDNDDFTSSDDESLPDEDVPTEEFKVYSNPLFDDEINSDEIDPHYFNTESDFVKSLSNRDTLIDSSPKFDFLEEFSGAFMPTSIADEHRIRREHAEYVSLMEMLFTINPCPRPMENSNTLRIVTRGQIDLLSLFLYRDILSFGEDDDGVEDEGGGSVIVNSGSFSDEMSFYILFRALDIDEDSRPGSGDAI
nr:hypothetical protein [Tanacetum cinerariifolium]